jgi:hypothetical protein
MLKVPNEKQTKRIWKSTLKKYGLKQITWRRFFRRGPQRYLEMVLKHAGLDLRGRSMVIPYKDEYYLLTPSKLFKGLGLAVNRIGLLAHLAHELEHRFQADSSFLMLYVFDHRMRAYFETESLLAEGDVYHALGRPKRTPRIDDNFLGFYALQEKDVVFARQMYERRSRSWREGHAATKAGGAVLQQIRKELER